MAFLPALLQGIGVPLMAQLAVSTATSTAVASTACQVVGGAYPAYATFRSREMLKLLTRIPHEAAVASQASSDFWLEYWACFAALVACEALLRPGFTGYQHLKLLLLLWLQSKRYRGAHRVYTQLLVPGLRHVQPGADRLLASLGKLLALHDVQILWGYAHEALKAVPVLEWFVRED